MDNLLFAARPLLNDLAPTLLFAVMMAAGVPPTTAMAVAIGLGVGAVVLNLARGRAVAPLQWASLGLVLAFGAASLMTHDVRWLMAKPTVVYLILAAVMMKRGWMTRYLPPVAVGRGEGLMITFGYVWAGLMVLTAGLNLVLAVKAPAVWPVFLAVFPMASKIVLFGIQFTTVRWSVRRRMSLAVAA